MPELPAERGHQLFVAVLGAGTYLARRYDEDAAINLYHLFGRFFVEVYYDPHANAITRLRAFSSQGPLEEYAAFMTLAADFASEG